MPSKRIREMTPEELAFAPDDIAIAWNFVRIRESLGLTQAKAAEMGGTTVGYVGKIETAAVSFGTRAQQKWSRLLAVDRTEFLRRPEAGIAVIGAVTEKGTVTSQHEVEHVPPLADRDGENTICLKVATDALHPHLRKDSYLYAVTVLISAIRNDNLVIYAEEGELGSIKEAEWLADGKIVLKGLGRGSTITKDASELPMVRKVVFICM